mmetsp:Transcript_65346/g.181721  ORF Transcript_65346/g.181721 Transcript_65346/m.181721 type:complete len:186 (+) Transcript_65346:76-633(+)|eukprot:CAMPEP_0117552996 /NCGR_PEP_ID=MMETSP0784-20121206/49997_1 /TAXON_ID=39447 /ORGANISM="" /LENGTH=185 /DNA_ID=CAMNT_0005350089 /DNA_START=76 /DNA_END=633 /DNA_ORIENTATION=-
MADLLGFTDVSTTSPDGVASPDMGAAPFFATAAAPPQTTDCADPFAGMPMQDTSSMGVPAANGARAIPELNALREWEDKHEQKLEEFSRQESKDKEAKRAEATSQLQKYYADRQDTIAKKKASNRAEEEVMEKSRQDQAPASGANPWERVAELIDANARAGDNTRDTSRMRSLLIQLKTNPIVSA